MQEQPLDLKATFKAVRRHRLLVVMLAALGVGAGVAYTVSTPPMPEARSLILLPPSAMTGNPGPSPYTQTQEIIVTSTPVLSAAGASVSPPVEAASLRTDVTASAPSQDVLQIAVRAQTVNEAERLANAVATSYVAYVGGVANTSEALLKQLQQQANELTSQILALQRKINAAQSRLAVEPPISPSGEKDSSLVNTLSTEQQQLSADLGSVNIQLTNAEVSNAQATSATRVLQNAEAVAGRSERAPVSGLLGGLSGLVAGCVVAVVRTRRDRRLGTRDAVAAAVGLPVIASMWAERCKRVGDWRRLLEHSKNPSPIEAWTARRTLQRLIAAAGDRPQVEVRLLVFAGDDSAAAAAVKLAGSAAALGMRSRLEVGPHPALTALRGACIVTSGAAVVDLKAESTTSAEFAGLVADVLLEAIDAVKPQITPSFATTILVVASGFATPSDLARVALAASDAGSAVTGVVLTNPDPDDNTSGLLPEWGEPPRVMPRGLEEPVPAEMASGEEP